MTLMRILPKTLKNLVSSFRKLSSVGQKTAERYAFELFEWSTQETEFLAEAVRAVKNKLTRCDACYCIKEAGASCPFCDPVTRNEEILCIVSHIKDPFLIEESRAFKGLYHVLPNLFSPFEEKDIASENIQRLLGRLEKLPVKEVILALDTTLEGDATALYFQNLLRPRGVKVTRLAYGIPIGSNIHYFDSQTLHQALSGRQVLT